MAGGPASVILFPLSEAWRFKTIFIDTSLPKSGKRVGKVKVESL
jgi:hypothetical protein